MGSLQEIRAEYEVNKYLHLIASDDGGGSRLGSSAVSDYLNHCLELMILRLAVQGAFVVLAGGSSVRIITGGHKLDPKDALSKVEFEAGNSSWLSVTDADLSKWKYLFQQTVTKDTSTPFSVPDLRHNRRTARLSSVRSTPHLTFYAATPLMSKGGHTIAILFVVDTKGRSPLTTSEVDLLENTAKKCVKSLDHAREQSFRNSWICKKEQLGTFTESQPVRDCEGRRSTTTRAEERTSQRMKDAEASQKTLAEFEILPSEGQECERLAEVKNDRGKLIARHDSVPASNTLSGEAESHPKSFTGDGETIYRKVFRRAAQCLQTALDADGVLFADGLNGFHGDTQVAAETHQELEKELEVPLRRNSGQSDGEDELNTRTYTSPHFRRDVRIDKPAEILWVIDQCGQKRPSDDDDSKPNVRHSEINEGFLSRLMGCHPTGAMWYFTDTSMMQVREGALVESQLSDEDERKLRSTFPNIRQLIFTTLHDHTTGKRLSACFLWRNRTNPLFSETADLSALELFTHVIESEIGRHDTAAAAKQKDTFVSSVSHELRTPLHGILGAVQLLEESGLDPLQKSLADIITTCGSTLHETLTSVLSYAKINQFKRHQQESRQGRLPVSQWALSDKDTLGSSNTDRGLQNLYINTNVAMLCEELVGVSESGRSFQSSANEDVIVVCNISYEENWCYFTEPGALRRIAINIIGNALKYTKSGSIIISLTATELARSLYTTSGDGNDMRTLNLTVEDTGKGMSKSFLRDSLFIPFTQEDSTSSHGVGLGMSIVKNLVSLLGGEIHVQSKVGSGTKITVTLPMRVCDPKEDRASSAPGFGKIVETLRSRNLSVIVFGFPDFVRSSLETYLREWYHCRLLEAIDDAHPDIILVDEGNEKTLEEVKRTAQLYGKQGVLLSAVLVISKMAKRMDTIEGYKKWERIPRPLGPRNVGKGLLGCLSKLDELKKHGEDVKTDTAGNESKLNKQTEQLSSEKQDASTELPMWAFERLQLSNNRDTAPLEQELSTSTDPENQEPPPRTSDLESDKPNSKRDSKLQILLVDDNVLNLKLLSGFFQRKGYHDVQQAKHGAEAVDAVQKCTEGFDIVFMDMSMPIMDGFEATREIRRLESDKALTTARRSTFIVALTGLASASDEEEAYNAGVDMFITKPLAFQRLSTLLRNCEEGNLKTDRSSDES